MPAISCGESIDPSFSDSLFPVVYLSRGVAFESWILDLASKYHLIPWVHEYILRVFSYSSDLTLILPRVPAFRTGNFRISEPKKRLARYSGARPKIFEIE